MKKTSTAIISTVLFLIIFVVSASTLIIGDLDGDGKVLSSDARIVLRASAQIISLDEEQFKAGDVDGNGKLTASDARKILRVSARLDSSLSEDDSKVITTEPAADSTTTAPTTVPPTTEPTTVPPTTEPTTVPSTTEPTTVPPTTEPTTVPPTTEPTTVPPTTEPTTVPPTTEPTTVPPTTEPTTVPPTTEPTTVPQDLTSKEIYKIAAAYSVEITAEKSDAISTGTGFYISSDGQLVTNYHVIDGAYDITVTDINGNDYKVTDIIAYDADKDIAVLKINTTVTPAVVNTALPETGEVIYTLGSSKGFTDTFTSGMVSNSERKVDYYNPNMTYIQISAPITNGNSGGPLINEKGEVIGINTWGRTDGQNLNFSIPTKYISTLDYSKPLTMAEFGALFTSKVTGTLSVAQENVYLQKGGSACIRIDADINESVKLTANCNTNYVQTEWSDWYYDSYGNGVIFLFVSGINNTSETKLEISVKENPDIKITINVSVSSSGWTVYGGDPAVPDFGAYCGTAPRSYYLSDEADGMAYCYSFYDLPTSDTLIDGYINRLISSGYVYYDGEKTSDNVTVYYVNSAKGVMLGITVYNRDLKLIIAFTYL